MAAAKVQRDRNKPCSPAGAMVFLTQSTYQNECGGSKDTRAGLRADSGLGRGVGRDRSGNCAGVERAEPGTECCAHARPCTRLLRGSAQPGRECELRRSLV